jgi:hypothetical protein
MRPNRARERVRGAGSADQVPRALCGRARRTDAVQALRRRSSRVDRDARAPSVRSGSSLVLVRGEDAAGGRVTVGAVFEVSRDVEAVAAHRVAGVAVLRRT